MLFRMASDSVEMPDSTNSVGAYMWMMVAPQICEKTISTIPMTSAMRTPG